MKPNKYILAYAMFVAAIMAAARPAPAQQITGTPGSPNATTTIDGKYVPTPPPKFGGDDQPGRQKLQAVLAAARRAAQGRAQRAAHHDRRPGLRHFEHLRRCHPNASAGPDCEGRASIYPVPLHLALLALASGTAHRTQPSRRGIWCDC